MAVGGGVGWFASLEMVGLFEGGENRVRAIVATATELGLEAKRLQNRLIWYLTFHDKASKQRILEISAAVKQHIADLEGTIKIPEAKGILEKAKEATDALLAGIGNFMDVHDREYAATNSFDMSQHAKSVREISRFSSMLRAYAVELAHRETDYLNRQEAVMAATRSISFAERAEAHLLLYLTLGDEVDRAKFYQRIASLDQQIHVLGVRVVAPDGAKLVAALKAHGRELSLAGKALIQAYDRALKTKSRFILADQTEWLQGLRSTTRRIDTVAMDLAQWNLELETKPKAIALAQAANLQRNVLLVALAAVIVALGLGYTISLGISRPIAELTNAAREIGKGKLTTRVAVEAKDEIGELAVTFNTMSADLLRTTVSKDYVESVVGCMADALIVTSAEGLIKRVNKAAADLLGYAEDELPDKPLGLILPDDRIGDSLPWASREPAIYAKGEITLLSKSGQPIPVICSISQFTDSSGSVQGMVLTAKDISELKRAEEDLKEKTLLNRILLDAFPCVALLLRPHTREIVASNQAGLEAGAVPGNLCYATWGRRNDPCPWCLAPTLWATGNAQHAEIEVLGATWDAHWIPVDENLYMHYVFDITERKRAEQERQHWLKQVLHSQKMEAIGTLTGGIAHDFNNLLTIINGYTQLILSEKTDDDDGYSDLQKILETGLKGADLVKRLLAFSKKADIRMEPLDLRRTAEDSSKLMERTFPKMIEIETVLGKDLSRVNADASQIEQVLMNLCINAKEAMPEGGRLRIEVENTLVDEDYCRLHAGGKPGPHVLLEVSDTGTGLDKETMERIFDPFFTTKGWDFNKGKGLGLSVARGIVEQHGGWITCQSEQGKGATFACYFPIIEDSPAIEKPGPAAETVPGVEHAD